MRVWDIHLCRTAVASCSCRSLRSVNSTSSISGPEHTDLYTTDDGIEHNQRDNPAQQCKQLQATCCACGISIRGAPLLRLVSFSGACGRQQHTSYATTSPLILLLLRMNVRVVYRASRARDLTLKINIWTFYIMVKCSR